MTEQIKILESFKETFSGKDNINAIDIAIRSLNAWDEVLNELEELKQDFKNDRNFREASAVNISIKRIKQKLSEIERK